MGRSVTLRLVFVVWALLALSPVLGTVGRSLFLDGRFSPAAYAQLLTSAREWRLLAMTLLVAGGTALGAGIVGVSLAPLLVRSDLPGRRFLFLFALPGPVLGIGLISL